ncbi:MAG: hypothetical protein F4107_04120 [Gemmatimonadetes bacterium]|nr:hypothetical protein [Gemmatimonadota bacterium]MYD14929.1 hypothetical protein [Gemmatimonadota bacterium]MYI65115.1 hypothetical protein [Gemmatimonadota bacterium]
MSVTGATFARMVKSRHAFRSRKATAFVLLLQLAAISGLSIVEASHDHVGPNAVQWRSDSDDHPGDGQSAHAQCTLCGHGGVCMLVVDRAGVVHAPAVHGVRSHLKPGSRLTAVDAGFSTRSRAPPGYLI